MKYCHNCGAEIPEGSKFCGNCGISLTVSNDPIEEVTIVHGFGLKDNNLNKEQRKKGKRSGFLWLLVILAIVACALVLYTTKDVYVISKITYQPESSFTRSDKDKYESFFNNTYLYKYENDYYVGDIESGLGFNVNDTIANSPDNTSVDLSVQGNYAYLIMKYEVDGSKATISYHKASLGERFNFFTRYCV